MLAPQRNGVRAALPVLAVVTVLVGLPLMTGRVLSGQDIVNYLIIAQQTAANFREGIVLPAWAGGFNAGFGSPLLMFFPPLTGWLNAVPVLLGVPVSVGIGVLALVAHLLSGCFAYVWLRSNSGPTAALPASIVYMIAPYRFVDLYLRSALAEHWAFIWPPLILWSVGHRRLSKASRTALVAIAVSGLLLTNLPLAVLFGLALSIWLLATWERCETPFAAVNGAALGFGIAAFMLVPQALASRFLNLEICFGPDSTRLRASANTLFVDGFESWSLNTVFSLALVATFTVVAVGYLLLPSDLRRQWSHLGPVVAAIVCLLATTSFVGPIWDALPILSSLQFPWRLNAVMTLLAAALVARLVPRRAWILTALTLALAVPFASWDRTAPKSMFHAPRPPHHGSTFGFPDPMTAWEAGSGGWYWRHELLVELCLVPHSMRPSLFDALRGLPSPKFDGLLDEPMAVVGDPAAVVQVSRWGQKEREIEVETSAGGRGLWHVVWFPEMVIAVDGVLTPSWEDADTGLVTHRVNPGRHRVSWTWQPPIWLRIGRLFSLMSIMILLAVITRAASRRRQK